MKRDSILGVLLVFGVSLFTHSRLVADDIAEQLASHRPGAEKVRLRMPADTILLQSQSEVSHLKGLRTLLEQAHASLELCRRQIRDYTCTFIAQERIDGRLGYPKCCQVKVRHESGGDETSMSSTSIYLKFQTPKSIKGREVLWLGGANDGKMLVRKGGRHLAFMTAWIEPTSDLAMHENKYSIHEFGIKRLIERLVEVGTDKLSSGECQVEVRDDVNMDDRRCTCFEVVHPVQQEHLPFQRARIYIDNELQLPIGFEAYDWPGDAGDQPVLMERYLYRDLKLNVGLTDADFDKGNPEYQFQ